MATVPVPLVEGNTTDLSETLDFVLAAVKEKALAPMRDNERHYAVLNSPGGRPYPEVTGYFIPTLLECGEVELAKKCGRWLLSQQSGDGSFKGIDGAARVFDTSAICEGLLSLGDHLGRSGTLYSGAARKAASWISLQYAKGNLKVRPDSDDVHFYNIRAMWILKQAQKRFPKSSILKASIPKTNLALTRYAEGILANDWPPFFGESARVHYIAYASEGLMKVTGSQSSIEYTAGLRLLRKISYLRDPCDFSPFWLNADGSASDDTDYGATAQVNYLRSLAGVTPFEQRCLLYRMSDQVYASNGFFPGGLTWNVKFFIDAINLYLKNTEKGAKK
jgi:hypothetical protein